ncbi:MAG: hypothetical protein FJ397_10260 [Verrucomicrobia bacterium]|nr:hypothetical protein [Verrucomicrobiota bacterium]
MTPRPDPARLPPEPDPLAAWTHATLRALPSPTAPATLAGRVLAELARREARPWWRREVAGWPRSARLIFVLTAGAGAILSAAAFHGGTERLAAAMNRLTDALAPLAALGPAVLRSVAELPAAWLQGLGFAFCTSLAAVLALVLALTRLLAPRA